MPLPATRTAIALASALSLSACAGVPTPRGVADADWPAYGRTALGDRHSPLTQISTANVGRLAVAWRYHTGETEAGREGRRPARLSVTPIVVDGTMYVITPFGRIAALDASTGRERWVHDARVDRDTGFGDLTSRGVSYWRAAGTPTGAPCERRIVVATVDARLLALDAATGAPCRDFGDEGVVDLHAGLRNAPRDASEYEVTSPPAIVGDVVVVGSGVADNGRIDAASGEVRGFDVVSGRRLWTWDPVPQDPADPAYASWRGPDAHRTGGANTWSVIAADPQRGLVFLPTSSPSVDYWGGARLGDNRHANSLVALDARTGRQAWAFQTVHHDLWDYDNAAPPALVDLRIGGRIVAAVLQATKSGQLFVLDRATGVPLVPVDERAVPSSDVPGEAASPTQPFSRLPSLSPMTLGAADFASIGDAKQREGCVRELAALRNEGPFTPPSLRGTLVMPSNIGGAHWGGVAFDPATQTAIVPVNHVAAVITLLPRDSDEARRGETGAHGERIGLEYASMRGTPYVLKREYLSAGGRLCTASPMGSLHAIRLDTGTTAWDVPLGARGNSPGLVNLGGAITTAGGLAFIGATPDASLRAFDIATGRVLWTGALPAGARSTPMTYRGADGRQFVAIAAGGDGDLWGHSDEIVAFALDGAAQ